MAQSVSMSDLYRDDAQFIALLNRIAIPARERNKLIAEGFTNMESIILHHRNDVKGFTKYLKELNKTFAACSTASIRVNYSPRVITKLNGIVHYFNLCVNTLHTVPNITAINENDAITYGQAYIEFTKISERKTDDDVEITVPDFKDNSNWVKFRDAVKAKMSRTIGSRGIPVSYVIDMNPRAITRPNAAYLEVETPNIENPETFVSSAVHFGPDFKVDNRTVWDILKALLINTPGWYHISDYDRTRNGRQAWSSLIDFYQGEDFEQYLIDEAFSLLNRTFYNGETKSFSFEKYVQIHLKAHSLLVEAHYNNGRGMDEATKVQHFKTGIRPKANLEMALTTMRAGRVNTDSFHAVKSFLAAEVNARKVRNDQLSTQNKTRYISSFRSGNNKRKPGKNKRKNNHTAAPSAIVDGKRIEGRSYPRNEWLKLTPNQRTKVKELNLQRRNKSTDSTSVAALSASIREDMTSLGEVIVASMNNIKPTVVDTDDSSALTESNISNNFGNKRKAVAGSVGELLAQRKSRR